MEYKTGFYTSQQLPMEKYHAIPDSISGSGLATIRNDSEAQLRYEKDHPKESDALTQGANAHAFILEPGLVEKTFVVLPDDCRPGSGKGMKERKEKFLAKAEAADQTVVTAEERDKYLEMAQAIEDCEEAQDLLKGCLFEISGLWREPDHPNILCKTRPDALHPRAHRKINLKTTSKIDDRSLENKAYELGYHLRAAWGLHGLSEITGYHHKEYWFIYIRKTPVHHVKVWRASDEFLALGHTEAMEAFHRFAEAHASGKWPGISPVAGVMDLPAWKRKELMAWD